VYSDADVARNPPPLAPVASTIPPPSLSRSTGLPFSLRAKGLFVKGPVRVAVDTGGSNGVYHCMMQASFGSGPVSSIVYVIALVLMGH